MRAALLRELADLFWIEAAHRHDPDALGAAHDEDHRGDEERLFRIARDLERDADEMEATASFANAVDALYRKEIAAAWPHLAKVNALHRLPLRAPPLDTARAVHTLKPRGDRS